MKKKINRTNPILILIGLTVAPQAFADPLEQPVCRYNVITKKDGFTGHSEKPISDGMKNIGDIDYKEIGSEQAVVSNGDFEVLQSLCQGMAEPEERFVEIVERVQPKKRTWTSWFKTIKTLVITRKSKNLLVDDSLLDQSWMVVPIQNNKRVFTAYFSGTGSHAGDVENIDEYALGEHVASMVKITEGESGIDFYHLDGPGSGERRSHERRTGHNQIVNDTKGQAFGSGTNENIREMMAVILNKNINPSTAHQYEKIKDQLANGELSAVTHVNCFGWSRGGVQCIDLAWSLYHDASTRDIKVNIFAIDPVPGLLNFSLLWSGIDKLYPNVENFHAVYARHEFSFGFTPILPAVVDSNLTKVWLDQLPGYHATLSGNHNMSRHANRRSIKDKPLLAVGLVARHLAEQFLMEHGTSLKSDAVLNFSDEALLYLYREIFADMDKYERLSKESYTGLKQIFGKSRKMSTPGRAWNLLTSKVLLNDVLKLDTLPFGIVNNHHLNLVNN